MKDYSKQIEREQEKLADLENKLEEFKAQTANKINEMNSKIKQQKEVLAKTLELDKQEKLSEIVRQMSTKGVDVNMLFNAVQSNDLYGIQEKIERGAEFSVPENCDGDEEDGSYAE